MTTKPTPMDELLETLATATAEGRLHWQIDGCGLSSVDIPGCRLSSGTIGGSNLSACAVSFLCWTDWAHFTCSHSPAEGSERLSIMIPVEPEDDGDPEFVTAEMDAVNHPLVGILFRCLADRFQTRLRELQAKMQSGVLEANRKLVAALKEREKGHGDDG